MGTNNFLNKNASKIFACELQDEYSTYEDLEEILTEEINEVFGNQFDKEQSYDDERYYSGTYLGDINHDYRDCTLRLKPIIRAGYYDGCNLDYEIEFVGPCSSFYNSLNELEDSLYYHKAIINNFKKQLPLMIKKLEEVFATNSTPLDKIGGFSDGTAIYKKSI
mgnify:FL=1